MELDERPTYVRRHHGNVAAGEVGDAGRRALVWNMHDVGCADQLFEQFTCEIRERAGAGGAIGQFAWISFCVGDEFGEGARGN